MDKTLSLEVIKQRIFIIRGQKVMMDYDLALLYGAETKQLKRAVKRNMDRFASDFMFKITKKEYDSLRCQFGTLKRGEHSKYLPYAFTEQGVAMLSTVLNSKKAIQVNIAIMRAFVKLREVLAAHKELADRLAELERRMDKKDRKVMALFESIRRLMAEPEKPKNKIGFRPA